MAEVVDAEFVRQRLADGSALVVNVLPEDGFEGKRIPGSVSAPVDAGFEARLRGLAPDPDQPIIVHCASAASPASARAARLLEAMGYTEVYRFAGGLEAWATAGGSFEGGGEAGQAGRRGGRPERCERPGHASTGLPLTGRNRP